MFIIMLFIKGSLYILETVLDPLFAEAYPLINP